MIGRNRMTRNVKEKLLTFLRKSAAMFGMHPAVMAVLSSLLIAFANELLSRRSLIAAFLFAFTKPLLFLCNAAVVMVVEAVGLLFKKRNYMMTLFSFLILALGITNFVVCCFRQTPFSSMDFTLVKSVFPILTVYLSFAGLLAILAGLIALIVFLVYRWKKAAITPVRKKYAAVTLLSSLLAAVALIGTGRLTDRLPARFSNLADAYRDYGFTYCFMIGIIDRGIDEPEDYDDMIHGVVSEILAESTETETLPDGSAPDITPETTLPPPGAPESDPNILFLQLESFIDLKLLDGFSFSEDPTPVFSELKRRFPSGILTVPSVGAGTANTEFEVLSGMSLKWFGAGEYPYETVLQKTTCETVCYNLAPHGYTSHAVHNYKANFYGRGSVFRNLGFHTFTPIEYMNGVETNSLGWAKDEVLTDYVLDAMASTEGPDLVYCITVQGHGKYPVEGDYPDSGLITALPEEANRISFDYYIGQLRQTDAFLGTLLRAVEETGEDTVVVLFGDHIPNIGIRGEWLPDGMTPYQTEYVLWRSGGWDVPPAEEDITSYQLSAKVLESVGFDDGVLTKLHQEWRQKDTYEAYLEMLEYDILYGERFAYGGVNPFKPTDLKLGIRDIVLTGVRREEEGTVIEGENFTKSSRIFLNGIMRPTEFLDGNTLLLPGLRLRDSDTIRIVQISDGIFQVGQTDSFRVSDYIKEAKQTPPPD